MSAYEFVGPDKGEGGKYLILRPDFKGESPEGYFTFKSSTYNVFVLWRAFRDEDGGTKEGVALMERTKIYPLSKKDNPPEMVFPNGTGRPAWFRLYSPKQAFLDRTWVLPDIKKAN